ncbi:putative acetyltransferase [Trypanosoma grayi]|uniref:putative acetyltransferase n=1 Tax=Trypanosoma grayi TaxID=71804 RepID=UPI0004F422F4|nr:putative acetyltransferase [Trypanosoma grayi]KEG15137.1 putative acetyltransferase [Trypanosoma grayi]
MQSADTHAPELVTLRSRVGTSLSVEVRWGIQQHDIEGIKALHGAAFPVKYEAAYYQWLLTDACVAVVAYTTADDIESLLSGGEYDDGVDMPARVQDNDDDVDGSGGGGGSGGDVGSYNSLATYTVPVGFCIGQLAHVRRHDGKLVASPTGYLGSFAVDEALRRCGIGELLLQRFLSHMHFKIWVSPLAYLDYCPPKQDAVSTPWWDSMLSVACGRLCGWQHVEENAKDKRKQSRVLSEANCSSDDAASPTQNERDRFGVAGVWLHCLSENTRLVLYYLKRGFTCAQLMPEFYYYEGLYHDAVLLVHHRDDARSSFLVDAALSTSSEEGVGDCSLTAECSLPRPTFSPCSDTRLNEDNIELKRADWWTKSSVDVSDVETSTEYTRLRAEWRSYKNEKVIRPNAGIGWAQSFLFGVNAAVALMGVVWLVTVGL